MANGWVKYFLDGNDVHGTDHAVAMKAVSWQSGRLSDMTGVSVEHDGFTMRIDGLGNFWQSDTMEVKFPDRTATILRRRIEKQIDPTDLCFRQLKDAAQMQITFNDPLEGSKWFPVARQWYGKWFVLEYCVQTKQARYFIADNKI